MFVPPLQMTHVMPIRTRHCQQVHRIANDICSAQAALGINNYLVTPNDAPLLFAPLNTFLSHYRASIAGGVSSQLSGALVLFFYVCYANFVVLFRFICLGRTRNFVSFVS